MSSDQTLITSSTPIVGALILALVPLSGCRSTSSGTDRSGIGRSGPAEASQKTESRDSDAVHLDGALALPAADSSPARDTAHRWAEALDRSGLPNLHRVSPDLYRGGQPSSEGFAQLAELGVKTVISLRAFHSDPAESYLLAHESISFKYWHPEDEDVVRFLTLATDPAKVPVFVHCWHGSDRTGMMCAIYRVAVEGWTKEEAVREMTAGPFDYHASMSHLVRYVRESDIGELARRAGLKSKAR